MAHSMGRTWGKRILPVLTAVLLVTPVFTARTAQSPGVWTISPDLYKNTVADDAITHLQSDLDAGRAHMTFDADHGYLRSMLALLKIPVSSQALVFSKTSFHRDQISPSRPRALYFNDATYVGWVQEADSLEIVTIDPHLGPVFYMLPQSEREHPRLVRVNDACLECHVGAETGGVPGLVLRSVYAQPDGKLCEHSESLATTDQTPIAKRWGGWYVTGSSQPHRGNRFASIRNGVPTLEPATAVRVASLKGMVETAPYLANTSDVVALMVFEHQAMMQTILTKAGFRVRAVLTEPDGSTVVTPSATASAEIAADCEPVVQAMLFSGEAPLTQPVSGTSGFAHEFAASGIRDRAGRSLKDLDLRHRLLKYPCSWMIYSAQFDALPIAAQNAVYNRLWAVLTGKDHSPAFRHLTALDRDGIRETLLQTKPSFAAWRRAATGKL